VGQKNAGRRLGACRPDVAGGSGCSGERPADWTCPGLGARAACRAVGKDDLKGLPFVILLHDVQFTFDADGWVECHEVMARVQTPDGPRAPGVLPP
jgi:hypothetical protein